MGSYLKKEDTHFSVIVLVQEKITMSLRSGNGVQNIGDLYGVHMSRLSKTMREYYKVIRKHLQLVFGRTCIEGKF